MNKTHTAKTAAKAIRECIALDNHETATQIAHDYTTKNSTLDWDSPTYDNRYTRLLNEGVSLVGSEWVAS